VTPVFLGMSVLLEDEAVTAWYVSTEDLYLFDFQIQGGCTGVDPEYMLGSCHPFARIEIWLIHRY